MKLKVAVIFGGKSAEHEVSLRSATNIFNAVDRARFTPLLIGVDKNGVWHYNQNYVTEHVNLAEDDYFAEATAVCLLHKSGKVQVVSQETNEVLTCLDIIFPIIHGTYGEDGTLQGFLKAMAIPFVGPDVLGSAIAMDKDVAKRLLRDAGIPIAKFHTIYKYNPFEYSFEKVVASLGLPLFVKPANAGSSVGVSKVMDENAFKTALLTAFQYDNKVLVEEAVVGKEVECAVLGNEQVQASVVGEIVPTQDFYSYDAKYINADGANLRIPAEIDEAVAEEIRQYAMKAFKTTCCEGMARVDFFLTKENRLVLNELNTLPGFTEISMYPKLWEASGISYKDLITELITLSLLRGNRDSELLTEG